MNKILFRLNARTKRFEKDTENLVNSALKEMENLNGRIKEIKSVLKDIAQRMPDSEIVKTKLSNYNFSPENNNPQVLLAAANGTVRRSYNARKYLIVCYNDGQTIKLKHNPCRDALANTLLQEIPDMKFTEEPGKIVISAPSWGQQNLRDPAFGKNKSGILKIKVNTQS